MTMTPKKKFRVGHPGDLRTTGPSGGAPGWSFSATRSEHPGKADGPPPEACSPALTAPDPSDKSRYQPAGRPLGPDVRRFTHGGSLLDFENLRHFEIIDFFFLEVRA